MGNASKGEAIMDSTTKAKLKAQLSALSGLSGAIKAMINTPPPPAIGGIPPMPIQMQPSLSPLVAAMKSQSDQFDKMLKLLADVIDAID